MAIDSEYKVAVLTGKPGEDGNNLKIQYSKDNSSWHTTFATGDLYMRTSSDNGATWSAGMRIVGEKGDTGSTGPQGIQGIQGIQGERGGRDLSVTTAPSAYTTKVGTFTPAYRISLSTVKTQSGIDTVYVGDTLVYGVLNLSTEYEPFIMYFSNGSTNELLLENKFSFTNIFSPRISVFLLLPLYTGHSFSFVEANSSKVLLSAQTSIDKPI